jgi:predicted ATPase/DNA-binding CsgD family transcriptional regulator
VAVSGLIGRRAGELPVEVTGFVGRRKELAQLAGQLRGARLVTVTGPGGVGKTRTALYCAAALAREFADGVCLAELAGLADPGLLPNTVATCLGLPEQDARTQLSSVLEYLRDRQLLLILDTCEHLVDACAMLASRVLRETAGVTVLATSRQPLDVPGEHTCVIPPLPVPGPDARQGSAGDAVELFAQRAAAAVPGFAVTDASRADVIRLCRRLDGIPLAIELATVRLRAVPLEQLASRLEDRFATITGGRRSALPHHQTLRTATEWSYDLCSPEEQLLWARLSVFAGSFDIPAVEEVCAGDPLSAGSILATLIGLVDKSVVLRVEEGGARYRLLDTIREFGAERLTGAGEETRLRERHIARFLALADRFDRHAKGDDQLRLFEELRREHPDLRAALEYALADPARAGDAARLAAHLRTYWQMSGLLDEGKHWLTKVLGRFPAPSPERAWLLMTRGVMATFQGELGDGIVELQTSIAMAGDHGEALAGALGTGYLTLALAFAGRYDEAAQAGAAAEERLRALDDYGGLASHDIHMGYLYLLTGQLDLAIDQCAGGLRRLGDGRGEQCICSYLRVITSFALFLQDKRGDSAEAACRALEMKYRLGEVVGMAYCLEMLAWLATREQRYERATWLIGAAGALWERAGSRLGSNALLEEFHHQAMRADRDALGEDRFATEMRDAARHPIEEIFALAISDATEFRPAASRPVHEIRLASLTRRERQIAALVAEGLFNREIAERLVISKRTVDAHVAHILAKLGASSRVQIANWVGTGQPPRPPVTAAGPPDAPGQASSAIMKGGS